MTVTGTATHGVHLVGSVPLESAEAVFRAAGSILGDRLRRIPDGETGDRHYWIGWQAGVLANQLQLELIPPAPDAYAPLPTFKVRPGSGDVTIGDLGYAAAAMASYQTFRRLKEEGVLPGKVRFQVSLPTPLAVVNAFIVPEDQAAVEPAYEERLLAELDEIVAAVPHQDLAIQWDVAVEVAILEGVWKAHFEDVYDGVLERLVRIGNRVPADIELGYHLCYGDAEHQHFKQPEDTSLLVRVANDLSRALNRPINWIHLPVPRDRADDAYFAPLRHLSLPPETELYLGVVHATDGDDGTKRRIEAAQRAVSNFGVATECGMGRRPPESILGLLQIHADVTAPAE